jgi:apolipoprotein N-acyltransferase
MAFFFNLILSLVFGGIFGSCFTTYIFDPSLNTFAIPLRILVSSIAFLGLLRCIWILKDKKKSFFCGALFGTAYWAVALFDIRSAFEITNQSVLFLPCLLFLSAGLGLFIAVPCLFSSFFEKKSIFLFFFCFFWAFFEFLRSEFFPKFPLNLVLSLFTFDSNSCLGNLFIQIISITGIYFATFIWLLLVSSFYTNYPKKIPAVGVAFVLSICILFYGQSVTHKIHNKQVQNIGTVLIVQPNISQQRKLDKFQRQRNLIIKETIELLKEAQKKYGDVPNFIVLPESAIPGLISDESPEIPMMQEAIQDPRTILIFGADRLGNNNNKRNGNIVWHNSMYIVSKNKILGIYDKIKLLPFGEYIPLRGFFPTFFNYVADSIDCTPGKYKKIKIEYSPLPLINCSKFLSEYKKGELKSFPFLPKICSESLFKYKISDEKCILQILNDSWFGPSIMWQHLAIDRLRVIQARLPMIRVSNSGISVYISSTGEVSQKSQLPINKSFWYKVSPST